MSHTLGFGICNQRERGKCKRRNSTPAAQPASGVGGGRRVQGEPKRVLPIAFCASGSRGALTQSRKLLRSQLKDYST